MKLEKRGIEGIYYSTKTGRVFEAVRDNHGYVITRYCDNEYPEFGPVVSEYTFYFQFVVGIYEDVINYSSEGIC